MKWSSTTKLMVIISLLIVIALAIYRFRQIIPPIVISIILAYILSPLVDFIVIKTKLSRTWAVTGVYFALIIVLSLVPAILTPSLVRQFSEANLDFQRIVEDIGEFLKKPIVVFGFPLDLLDVYKEVSGTLQSIISSIASRTLSLLFELASAFLWLIFILVVSFYILKDMEKLHRSFHEMLPIGYREEIHRLGREINEVWGAFLRSQLVLCLVVGFTTGIAMKIIGMRNSLVLGIIAGILEIVPNIGPSIAAIPAVLIAYFRGPTYLPISNGWFALLVIVLYIIIQQVENHFLVPRIIGRSLSLHPLVVIIGAIVGANFAGILGILLASPTLATLRILGRYAYRKLLDLEPFPGEAGEEE
jgi:predicted PurR-regulated permease PerM